MVPHLGLERLGGAQAHDAAEPPALEHGVVVMRQQQVPFGLRAGADAKFRHHIVVCVEVRERRAVGWMHGQAHLAPAMLWIDLHEPQGPACRIVAYVAEHLEPHGGPQFVHRAGQTLAFVVTRQQGIVDGDEAVQQSVRFAEGHVDGRDRGMAVEMRQRILPYRHRPADRMAKGDEPQFRE